MDKIKYTVRSRPGTVNEIRPGNRALGRIAGSKTAVPSGLAHAAEVGQASLLHQQFAQEGIHTVKTDNNNLAPPGPAYTGNTGKAGQRTMAIAEFFKGDTGDFYVDYVVDCRSVRI